MISVLTPRMDAAIAQMTYDELKVVSDNLAINNDDKIWEMLVAKDAAILMDQIASDPLMQCLMREDVSWGDLMLATKTFHVEKKNTLVEEDADWIMPVLTLRKDIWENFPVAVAPVVRKDNKEAYSVQWHRKKFQEAHEACEHGWQYMDFAEDTYRRLIKALNASRSWTVLESQQDQDLCTIVMHYTEELKPFTLPSQSLHDKDDNDKASVASAKSVASDGWEQVPAKKSVPTVPILRRLNDIKIYFPVVWNPVDGCKSTTYAVDLFGKKIKEQGLNMNKVKADLLAALKASNSWTVLPSDKHACLLQMNHL